MPKPKVEETPVEEQVEEQVSNEKEEIKDLLDITPEEEEVEEVVEEEKEEVVEDKKEEEVEDKTKEKVSEEEKKEEVEEEVEEEIDPLLIKLGEISELLAGTPSKKEEVVEDKKVDEKKVEEKKESPKEEEDKSELSKLLSTPTTEQEVEFVSESMFDKVFESGERKQLNQIINKAVAFAVEETRKRALQDAIKVFPAMMDYKVQGALAAKDFWYNNPALSNLVRKYPKVKSFVDNTVRITMKNNPNYTIQEVYKETEKEVKEVLKERLSAFENQEDSVDEGSRNKPALPRKPGRGRKTVQKPSKPTSEQSEIMELIDFSNS